MVGLNNQLKKIGIPDTYHLRKNATEPHRHYLPVGFTLVHQHLGKVPQLIDSTLGMLFPSRLQYVGAVPVFFLQKRAPERVTRIRYL